MKNIASEKVSEPLALQFHRFQNPRAAVAPNLLRRNRHVGCAVRENPDERNASDDDDSPLNDAENARRFLFRLFVRPVVQHFFFTSTNSSKCLCCHPLAMASLRSM